MKEIVATRTNHNCNLELQCVFISLQYFFNDIYFHVFTHPIDRVDVPGF